MTACYDPITDHQVRKCQIASLSQCPLNALLRSYVLGPLSGLSDLATKVSPAADALDYSTPIHSWKILRIRWAWSSASFCVHEALGEGVSMDIPFGWHGYILRERLPQAAWEPDTVP